MTVRRTTKLLTRKNLKKRYKCKTRKTTKTDRKKLKEPVDLKKIKSSNLPAKTKSHSTQKFSPLPKKFYLRDTLIVARELLGKLIVRKSGNRFIAGKIVETEAYIGAHDPASHAYGRVTPRNSTLYMEGGICYVYFIYGNYFCFNTVTGKDGEGSGVLIRAVEPVTGIKRMERNRPKIKNFHDISNGPGKLCLALEIDKKLNRTDITGIGKLFVSRPLKKEKFTTAVSKRINIGFDYGWEFPYRFFIKDNPFVTKHKFNKEIIETL